VRQLRKKIEDDPAHPVYLLTDIYVGYRFADQQILEEAQAAREAGVADSIVPAEAAQD
jgi:two-component system KDP operon response regulator KdpE